MIDLSSKSLIYDVNSIPEIKNCQNSCIEVFNQRAYNLLVSYLENGKATPIIALETTDPNYIEKPLIEKLKKVWNTLERNKANFKDAAVVTNYKTFINFVNGTKQGRNFAKNLYVCSPRKILDWEKVVKYLSNPNFNFETSALLENWIHVGKYVQNIVEKTNTQSM